MLKPIHALWIGDRLSKLEQMCARSFVAHGHQFNLYTYSDLAGLPQGVNLRDARDILPESAVYRSDGGRLSSFSNYFRWAVLQKHGGFYVDMDVVCLKPLKFESDIIFGYESEKVISCAMMSFPRAHTFVNAMYNACDDVNCFQPIDTHKTVLKKIVRKALYGKEKSRAKTRFSEPGGPTYFTKYLRYYGLIDHAMPEEFFYPIPLRDWETVFRPDPSAFEAIKGAHTVHLWNNASGYTKTVDKDAPEPGSLFAAFCDQYL